MRKTGIFGGSFNPIHLGHLALAKEILRQGLVDDLWFVVSPQNPLKQRADLMADDLRLSLVRLAVRGEEHIGASDVEFHLSKPSYMADTLLYIRRHFPAIEPVLIIGEDNWRDLRLWRRWQEIVENYEIVVYPRRDAAPPACKDLQTNDWQEADLPATDWQSTDWLQAENVTPKGVRFMGSAPLFDVSSTIIRQMLREGRSIKGKVPEAVWRYFEGKK